jgi:hypothetical protein
MIDFDALVSYSAETPCQGAVFAWISLLDYAFVITLS